MQALVYINDFDIFKYSRFYHKANVIAIEKSEPYQRVTVGLYMTQLRYECGILRPNYYVYVENNRRPYC